MFLVCLVCFWCVFWCVFGVSLVCFWCVFGVQVKGRNGGGRRGKGCLRGGMGGGLLGDMGGSDGLVPAFIHRVRTL